jgi:anti-sigma regulatory factor (Ser/Thr protein kinase)
MEIGETSPVDVREPSQVSVARRAASTLAETIGFDEEAVGRVALAVTETATNLVRHGGGGVMLFRALSVRGASLIEILALDQGPGMANVDRSLEDGISSAGTAGIGLGAVRRLAATFDIYSQPGRGTALLARIGQAGSRTALAVAGVAVAMPGERLCGDAWAAEHRVGGVTVAVLDGLGHGPDAAAASAAALESFAASRPGSPVERLGTMHQALRATRGAAGAIADIDAELGLVRFAGLGNVAASILTDGVERHCVSRSGTLGHSAGRIEQYTYPWRPGSVLVMHSDGLATVRDFAQYPGLLRRHPGIVAGVLYRDHRRQRDDATVVVARGPA